MGLIFCFSLFWQARKYALSFALSYNKINHEVGRVKGQGIVNYISICNTRRLFITRLRLIFCTPTLQLGCSPHYFIHSIRRYILHTIAESNANKWTTKRISGVKPKPYPAKRRSAHQNRTMVLTIARSSKIQYRT